MHKYLYSGHMINNPIAAIMDVLMHVIAGKKHNNFVLDHPKNDFFDKLSNVAMMGILVT